MTEGTTDDARLPHLTFLGHASVLIELGGTRVLTDPVLRLWTAFLRRVPQAVMTVDPGRVDLVLLSHLHHDHCDLPSLRQLGTATPLVVPAGGGPFFRRNGFTDVTELATGETLERYDVSVTAVPAVHDGMRRPFGPRAEAVGYVVERGPATVYFAGDTDLFPGMADLADEVDVALIPVWGWGPSLGPGHLHPHDAARAVRLIRPRYAVPVHWGTLVPVGMSRQLSDRLYDPPREFARAVGRLAQDTQVLLTEPGRRVAFDP